MTTVLSDRVIYERVIRDAVPRAARRVWIATADIKDLYVEAAPGSDRMVPFVKVLADLIGRGVEVRLVHAKEEQFDAVWRGAFCRDCGRRAFCGDCPLD